MAIGAMYAGDFIIREALLISPTGSIADLLKDVAIVEINIFEDIMKSSLTGSIIIGDTNNVVSLLPIVGQEYLTLKLETPTFLDKDGIDFTESPFAVNRVNLRKEVNSGGQLYELEFVSQELLKNLQKKVSKSYSQRKGNVGEIVFDLLSNGIGTTKKVFIEPTTGNRRYITPNSNPFTVIKKLTNEAVSKKSSSPHYLFFENKNGIHFRSLQSLYNQEVSDAFHVGDKGFDEKVTGNDSESGKLIQSYKRVLAYEVKTNNDLVFDSMSGILGGRVISHDIFKKNYSVRNYNYFNDGDFGKHTRLDDASRLYNKDRFESKNFSNSLTLVVPTSKTSKDLDAQYVTKDKLNGQSDATRIDEIVLQRQQRILEYTGGLTIQMVIHGRTSITAGDLIHVFVPSLGDDEIDNELYTGIYLVTKLRHTFDVRVKQHEITMEVARDGLPVDLPSFGSQYSDIQKTKRPIQV